MNIRSNIMIALTLILGLSSQAYAADNKPQRPSFASLDSNGDVEIDFDEFSAHELPHGDHQTVFAEIDANGDGVISEQEYTDHKPPRPPKK